MGNKNTQERDTEGICYFWIVRHGERVDEVNRAWSSSHPEFSHWDPPLTDEGKNQAKVAAEHMKTKLNLNFNQIFVSPLARTLMTAEQIAHHHNKEVVILSGLSSCAIDVQRMGLKKLIDESKFLSEEKISNICPNLKVVHRNEEILNVEESLHGVAKKDQHICMVTHREAIYNLERKYGNSKVGRARYCAILELQYDIKTKEIKIIKRHEDHVTWFK